MKKIFSYITYRGILKALISICILASFLGLAQKHTNLLFSKKINLNFDSDSHKEKYSYLYKIDRKYQSLNTKENSYLILDGKKLNKKMYSATKVKSAGQGRYYFKENCIVYSKPLKLENVKNINGRLKAVIPLSVSWSFIYFFLTLAIACILLYQIKFSNFDSFLPFQGLINSFIKHVKKRDKLYSILAIILIFTLSVTVKTILCIKNIDSCIDAFYVNGMPYSDAMGWQNLANSLASGNGISGSFDGHRPFYAILLGFIRLIFSNSGIEIIILNILITSLAIVSLYSLFAISISRFLGLLISLFLIFSNHNLNYLLLSLTEILSTGLMIIAITLLYISIFKKSYFYYFVTGSIFAFSNLSQTMPILQLPILSILIFIYNFNWKLIFNIKNHVKALSFAIVFSIGVFTIFSPWIIRQKIKYDTYTLSLGGMDIMYGASTKAKKYNTQIYHDAIKAGVHHDKGKQYKFFSTELKKNILKDPKEYFSSVLKNMKKFATTSLDRYNLKSYFHLYIYLLVFYFTFVNIFTVLKKYNLYYKNNNKNILSVFSKILRPTFYIFSHALLAPFIYNLSTNFYTIILIYFTAWIPSFLNKDNKIRILVEILSISSLMIILLSGFMGDFSTKRFLAYINWIHLSLYCIASYEIIKFITKSFYKEKNLNTFLESNFSKNIIKYISFSTYLICISSYITIGYLNIFNKNSKIQKQLTLNNLEKLVVKKNLLNLYPEIFSKINHNKLKIDLIHFSNYECFISKNERTGHWARVFEVRNLNRFTSYVIFNKYSKLFTSNLIATHFHSKDLSYFKQKNHLKKSFILAYVMNLDASPPLMHDKIILEAIALIPCNVTNRKIKHIAYEKIKLFKLYNYTKDS